MGQQCSVWRRGRSRVPPISLAADLFSVITFPVADLCWRLVLSWSFECLLDAIVHSSNISCNGSSLDALAELRPVLASAAPGSLLLLDLAPGGRENWQVVFVR